MKNEKIDIAKSCWNKFKEIHSNKIEYLQKIYNIFNNLSKIFYEFENKYKSLEIDQLILPIENNKINETIKLINKSTISYVNTNRVMIKNILNSFKDIYELIKNENNMYEKVLSYFKEYDEEKQKMNQFKKNFYDKLEVIEDSIKSEILKNKSNNIKSNIIIDKDEMNEAIKEYNDYKISVGITNEKRENFNKSQNDLLKLYQKVIIEKEAELYQKINMNFYNVEKMENESTSMMIDKIKDKKKINKKEYNKEVISFYLSEEKEEQEFEIKNYNLKHKPYPTSNNCTTEEIIEASQISDEIISTMRKYLNANVPDCSLQIQEADINLPDIINKYLVIEIELTDQVKNDILKLIKEDLTIYPQLLTFLSRVRSSSKLYKSKEHIEFLGPIFKEILAISEQKKDFKAAQNCLLLSQTYFYKDEKTNQKTYLFEIIKHNKWINSSEFWRIFISNQIKLEFSRFESSNPDLNLNLEKNENIPSHLKPKIKEIFFTTLLPNISNMLDLTIDKRIMVKVIDEFIDKYKYLDEANINDLFAMISPDSNEISKFRKEYKENSNLENEIINEKEKESK